MRHLSGCKGHRCFSTRGMGVDTMAKALAVLRPAWDPDEVGVLKIWWVGNFADVLSSQVSSAQN